MVFKLYIKGRLEWLVKLKPVDEFDSLFEEDVFHFLLEDKQRFKCAGFDECEKSCILCTQCLIFKIKLVAFMFAFCLFLVNFYNFC